MCLDGVETALDLRSGALQSLEQVAGALVGRVKGRRWSIGARLTKRERQALAKAAKCAAELRHVGVGPLGHPDGRDRWSQLTDDRDLLRLIRRYGSQHADHIRDGRQAFEGLVLGAELVQ